MDAFMKCAERVHAAAGRADYIRTSGSDEPTALLDPMIDRETLQLPAALKGP